MIIRPMSWEELILLFIVELFTLSRELVLPEWRKRRQGGSTEPAYAQQGYFHRRSSQRIPPLGSGQARIRTLLL